MPEVHGLVGSPALEATGALLSAPTQPILEVLFTKPTKDVFVSWTYFAATTCTGHACDVIFSDLGCMVES